MIIPDKIKYILNELNNHNYEAYIVGGSLRDSLLGEMPLDYDITTNATPDEIKEVFNNLHIINNNGEKHGTVTVRYNKENIEITTFRLDGDYIDHRHPDNVYFTRSLEEDLKRRDFTINALAMDINGKIYDYFEGANDLKNKIIKCVGNPHKRFEEDALRILRGLRFASVLDFIIDDDTLKAMYSLKDTLKYVSKERIKTELDKMISGKAFYRVMDNELTREILSIIIPEIKDTFDFNQKSKYHPLDLYHHTLEVVKNIKGDYITKLAGLFHDIGKTKCYQSEIKDGKEIYHFIGHEKYSYDITIKNLKDLRYSDREIKEISFLVLYHDYKFSNNLKSVRKFMYKMEGLDMDLMIDRIIDLKMADQITHNNVELFDFSIIKELYNQIKNNENECYNLKTLKIAGNDLIELGYKGKEIGNILNDVLKLVIAGGLINDKDSLLKYVKRNYK